jgi:hypothetical protein
MEGRRRRGGDRPDFVEPSSVTDESLFLGHGEICLTFVQVLVLVLVSLDGTLGKRAGPRE